MSKQDKTDVATSAAGKAEERLDVDVWAARKGTPRWLVAAALYHADWPVTTTAAGFERLVTERDYDAAVAAVRSMPIR